MIDPNKISLDKLPLIVFSDFTSGLVEFLIKWRTKGSWNHVMWLIPGPDDRPIFASQGNVFSLAPLKRYMAENNRLKFVSVIGLGTAHKLALINSIYEKINRPWWKKTYDWLGIAGQAFGARWLNIPGAHICSEDVPHHLRKLVSPQTRIPPETKTALMNLPRHGSPEDLNDYFKARPEAFEAIGEWVGDRDQRQIKPAPRALSVIISIAMLLFGAFTSSGFAARNIQDNHQFLYQVIDASGNHVTGQTVTLKIKRVSDGYWYDFSDGAFKTSGWTSKSTSLSEDSTEGFYYYLFNPPSSETAAEQYQFLVDNASAIYGDHQSELVSYQNIGNSTFNSASNQVIVATNNDKTGYSISGTKTTLDALNDITSANIWAYSAHNNRLDHSGIG